MYIKISNILKNISFKLKQKSLYFEFKYYIAKKKSHIKDISYFERAMGKSYTLVELSHKYNAPIFVGNHVYKNHLNDISRMLYKKDANIRVADDRIRGQSFKIGLIEECVSVEIINSLIKPVCGIIIGYHNNY